MALWNLKGYKEEEEKYRTTYNASVEMSIQINRSGHIDWPIIVADMLYSQDPRYIFSLHFIFYVNPVYMLLL